MLVRNNITFKTIDTENQNANIRQPRIGIWGRRHSYYLNVFEHECFMEMIRDKSIYPYLELIEKQAQAKYIRLLRSQKKKLGVTAELKEKDFETWSKLYDKADQKAFDKVFKDILFNSSMLLIEDGKYAPKKWRKEHENNNQYLL